MRRLCRDDAELRREVEALRANVEQQRALLGATYLSLTSNISNAAIASAAYAQEVEDTQRLAGMEREQLVLIKAQVDAHPYASELMTMRKFRLKGMANPAQLASAGIYAVKQSPVDDIAAVLALNSTLAA